VRLASCLQKLLSTYSGLMAGEWLGGARVGLHGGYLGRGVGPLVGMPCCSCAAPWQE
jgi:hypothetical protein